MANLELTGRLNRKLPVQSGVSARGEWSKQEFVLDFQDGNYPATACFNVWGEDKVKELERFQIGDDIKVTFRINSREFNGKWYTDLRAWRIEYAAAEAQQPAAASTYSPTPQQPSAAAPYQGNVPAGFAPSAPAPPVAPSGYDEADGSSDDLPF